MLFDILRLPNALLEPFKVRGSEFESNSKDALCLMDLDCEAEDLYLVDCAVFRLL
jgi:hypothetical protein